MTDALSAARREIVSCARCSRLREYCERVAVEKRAAYRHETYWAKPVPGYGDPSARIVIVGLAPAAHGANRTGRMFTGDGAGGSGDFLAAALHANELASQSFSRDDGDGQTLNDTWILAAVRCAPPDNKPTPEEIAHCHVHLRAEVDALPHAKVFVALGRIAFDACLRVLADRVPLPSPRPTFAHGAEYRFAHGLTLVASYHPSRQNTNTGRLTPDMLRTALRQARAATGTTDKKSGV